MWRDIKQIIQSHQTFLITTHVNPDGDGVGAACALTELLLQMGKQVRFVCDSPIPRKFSFLDYHNIHEVYDSSNAGIAIDVLIVLDTHKRDRIGRLARYIDDPAVVTLCIDHHEVAEPFTPHLVIDPKACSVGAMVYSLYQDWGFDLNLRAATGIYASLVCDTGRFSYSSTSRSAHEIAGECIRVGVDPELIYSRLFQHVSFSEVRIFTTVLQEMESYCDHKVIVQQISKEASERMGLSPADLEHIDLDFIHDFNHSIEGVQCFVLLREVESNRIRVSLRSKSSIDVSHIVREWGGGGHANAAGLTWNGSLEEIKQRILAAMPFAALVK